jgi:NAD(P)-dependent dehydrogenase (short-subunit alcohol dehydrogenase family)
LAHEFAPKDGIHFEDLNDKEKYDPWKRYGETKLANIHFTQALQKRLDAQLCPDSSVFVNAVHPGVVETELGRNLAEPRTGVVNAFLKFARINARKGAITQIFVAGAKEIQDSKVKGKYFVPYNAEASPNAQGVNEEYVQKTWEWTEKVLKEKFRSDWKGSI